MATLTRLFDFAPNTKIKSQDVDDELNQLVSGHNTQDTSIAAASLPSGTRVIFDQASAPTGWTRDTTGSLNDRVIRIVTGARADGGTWTVAGLTKDAHTHPGPSHTHPVTIATFALGVTHLPAHTHGSGGAHAHDVQGTTNTASDSTDRLIIENNRSTGQNAQDTGADY